MVVVDSQDKFPHRKNKIFCENLIVQCLTYTQSTRKAFLAAYRRCSSSIYAYILNSRKMSSTPGFIIYISKFFFDAYIAAGNSKIEDFAKTSVSESVFSCRATP